MLRHCGAEWGNSTLKKKSKKKETKQKMLKKEKRKLRQIVYEFIRTK